MAYYGRTLVNNVSKLLNMWVELESHDEISVFTLETTRWLEMADEIRSSQPE